MKLLALADVTSLDEKTRMAIAKFLTVCISQFSQSIASEADLHLVDIVRYHSSDIVHRCRSFTSNQLHQ